jgi:ubiquinone/menaquinone biosynthesis C-methylase UbiE
MERSSSKKMQNLLDDRPVMDVTNGIYAYAAIMVAHKLKLFPLLASGPQTLPDVCAALGIKPRPAQAILAASSAQGFVRFNDKSYSLTPLGEQYLLETSPTYCGFHWDLLIGVADNNLSFSSIERAVLTDAQQVAQGEHVFQTVTEQADMARAFTRAMHSLSVGPGLAWPEAIELSGCECMLDVGGGSGAHAIGAVTQWPHLRAVVLDLPPVCEVAREFIAKEGLQDRIETRPGDIFEDPFPEADLHFYSNIYHDWSREKGAFLTQKSFRSLPAGGRIVVHEMLLDDDNAGPFATAGYSTGMLLWSADGGQYSGQELTGMLTEAGFRQVETKPTFGYNSIVTAVKPAAAIG